MSGRRGVGWRRVEWSGAERGMGTRMDSSTSLWVEEDRAIEESLGIPANLKCHMHTITMVRAQNPVWACSKGLRLCLFTDSIMIELSSGPHF